MHASRLQIFEQASDLVITDLVQKMTRLIISRLMINGRQELLWKRWRMTRASSSARTPHIEVGSERTRTFLQKVSGKLALLYLDVYIHVFRHSKPRGPMSNSCKISHSALPTAAGRYHLYISWACPWANRCAAMLYLKVSAQMSTLDVRCLLLVGTLPLTLFERSQVTSALLAMTSSFCCHFVCRGLRT